MEMIEKITLESICKPSPDVVVRDIEGDTLIVPLAKGIGDSDDELYTVNETGQAILRNLDGTKSLREVSKTLEQEFAGSVDDISDDVLGFVSEMVKRGILVLKG